jgi:hypothetical protein
MTREFEELAFDGHNYPIWVLDVKISLVFRGIWSALSPPTDRDAAFLDTFKYQALFINIGSGTTKTMPTSFVTYSRLRSMMNLLLRIITNIMLGLFLSMRSITMRRKLVLLRIII